MKCWDGKSLERVYRSLKPRVSARMSLRRLARLAQRKQLQQNLQQRTLRLQLWQAAQDVFCRQSLLQATAKQFSTLELTH